ncbi:MAG: flagellar assembly protein H, partial [Cyanobacteria bacterium P01_F01_bin.53]
MSRIRYDQYFKEHIDEWLTGLGRIERSYEIPGEPLFIDLWFQPNESAVGQAVGLGLLGEIA